MFYHRGPDGAFKEAMQTSPMPRRRAFTMLELLVVITMIGLMSLMAFGRTSSMMTQWRVSRAAQALGEEIQSAFALVGRNRQPVTITVDTARMEMRLVDRNGVVFRRRNFGKESAYKLDAVNINAKPAFSIEVFPPGLAADSLSITISRNGKYRRIRMLRGGLVQICSNPSTLNGVCTPA
jgi:prepilin-type N-terminal cleavage/methylation domain-containing protein